MSGLCQHDVFTYAGFQDVYPEGVQVSCKECGALVRYPMKAGYADTGLIKRFLIGVLVMFEDEGATISAPELPVQ